MADLFRFRFLLAFASALAVLSSANVPANAGDLAWIRAEYAAVREARDGYTESSQTILGQSTDGAHAVAFADATGGVRLIEVTYYGETGRSSYEVYYADGQAFFILEQQYSYNMPYYFTEHEVQRRWEEEGIRYEVFDHRKTVLHEFRYYFDGDRLIRHLGPEPDPELGLRSSEEKAKEIPALANDLLSRFGPSSR